MFVIESGARSRSGTLSVLTASEYRNCLTQQRVAPMATGVLAGTRCYAVDTCNSYRPPLPLLDPTQLVAERECSTIPRYHVPILVLRLFAIFSDPVALIEHLGSRSSDLDEIAAIYRVLVDAAQQGSQFASVALWLGLWKGLDGVHRRWARRYTSDDELVADLERRDRHLTCGLSSSALRTMERSLSIVKIRP